MFPMEQIDIVNDQGEPTGEVVERTEAHEKGLLHRTSHVWLARIKDGVPQILLQRRCLEKDSYPGCLDISSAGHIPAGDDFEHSAIRELEEELGIQIEETELISCGMRRIAYDEVFHGKLFKDRQLSKVFVLWFDKEAELFEIQKEELDEVFWMDFDKVVEGVKNQTLKNCIVLEELYMIQKEVMKISQ